MIMAKRVIDFYLYSSLHVSLCFVAFYTVVSLHAGFEPSILELIAVGCSTLVGYNLAKFVHLIMKPFRFKMFILILTAICAVIGFVAACLLGFYAMMLFSFCGFLTLLYSLPQILGKSFRQVPILKLITISLTWCLLAVLLPHLIIKNHYFSEQSVFNSQKGGDYSILNWDVIKYMCLVIALCIPFEIRDLKYDDSSLRTLPQIIGVDLSKLIGYILLIISGVIEITQYSYRNVTELQVSVMIMVLMITGWTIYFSNRLKNNYYTSLYVEAIPILWLAIYLVVID